MITLATVNLSKGQRVSLSKGNPGLDSVIIGLGWDPVKKNEVIEKKGLFGRVTRQVVSNAPDIDCDAFAVAIKDDGDSDLLYFGNKNLYGGALYHTGDNLTGDGDGDDEQLICALKQLPSNVNKVVIGVNIYRGHEKGQTFGSIANAFVRIVDKRSNAEMCRYDLSGSAEYNEYVTMHFGDLERGRDGNWEFHAVGEPSRANSIGDFARNYNY